MHSNSLTLLGRIGTPSNSSSIIQFLLIHINSGVLIRKVNMLHLVPSDYNGSNSGAVVKDWLKPASVVGAQAVTATLYAHTK